jgi:hypothetical protein
MKIRLLAGLLVFAAPTAFAADSACDPVIKASEARASMGTWQSTTTVNQNFKMNAMKIGGQTYTQVAGEAWKKAPFDASEAERQLLAQIANGQITLSQCKVDGVATVEGIATKVISYVIKMPGADAVAAKLYVGKFDGLPYAQTSVQTSSRYRYTGLTVPNI